MGDSAARHELVVLNIRPRELDMFFQAAGKLRHEASSIVVWPNSCISFTRIDVGQPAVFQQQLRRRFAGFDFVRIDTADFDSGFIAARCREQGDSCLPDLDAAAGLRHRLLLGDAVDAYTGGDPEGAPLENSGKDYLANLRIQEAVYASDALGRRIELDGFESPD